MSIYGEIYIQTVPPQQKCVFNELILCNTLLLNAASAPDPQLLIIKIMADNTSIQGSILLTQYLLEQPARKLVYSFFHTNPFYCNLKRTVAVSLHTL